MKKRINRRNFLKLLSLLCVASPSGLLTSCAIDPVTGEKTLNMMSQDDEISIDRKQSPHQISADYGTVQDSNLNRYINAVGQHLAENSHRPQMPYSFQGVNATYINAYAFPGGTVACTRGLLIEMENEAELAALLGHEIGHVNARHSAERMTASVLAQAAVMGAAIAASYTDYRDYAGLVSQLGGIGAGALLAHYSRENEREADALGMEYMVRGGYDPNGMIGLTEILLENGRKNPSAIEMMFATHPMSSERYNNARNAITYKYSDSQNQRYLRERYMDNTYYLRRDKQAIRSLQYGEKAMKHKKYYEAERHFADALNFMPNDYAALVMMSKCQLALGRADRAISYTRRARQLYPQESQALHVEGVSYLVAGHYQNARYMFSEYEKRLPGNTDTIYFKAQAYEGMNDRVNAGRLYAQYVRMVPKGSQAKYAHARLSQWGWMQPTMQPGVPQLPFPPSNGLQPQRQW